MQEIQDYNFLIIGRSGAGKSATTKLLTGDPSVTVANSLKEVTTDVKFYKGMTVELGRQSLEERDNQRQNKPGQNNNVARVRFSVLDLPGLDRINNRFKVRQRLLQILQARNLTIHAIIYVTSLTQRDTIDCTKLFKFIQQLPWSQVDKKALLIPILTKYDNLIIDSPQQQITSIKEQYGNMFISGGYQQAWNKRVYWINHTKSLQFKIKIRQQIKEVYQKQIQRLLNGVRKGINHGKMLNAQTIRKYIQEEELYITKTLLNKISNQEIPCKRQIIEHHIGLKIIIRPKKFYQSITTVSASSIGMILSQLCKNQIPPALSMVLTGIPIALAFLSLTKSTTKMAGKDIHQNHQKVFDKNRQKLQNVCKQIYQQLINQWKIFNENLQFYLQEKILYCRLKPIHNNIDSGLIFIDPLSYLELRIGQRQFQQVWKMDEDPSQNLQLNMHYPMKLPNFNQYNNEYQGIHHLNTKYNKQKKQNFKNLAYPCLFRIQIPEFEDQSIWQPEISVQCGLKVFDQETLLKFVENSRALFDQTEIEEMVGFEYKKPIEKQ